MVAEQVCTVCHLTSAILLSWRPYTNEGSSSRECAPGKEGIRLFARRTDVRNAQKSRIFAVASRFTVPHECLHTFSAAAYAHWGGSLKRFPGSASGNCCCSGSSNRPCGVPQGAAAGCAAAQPPSSPDHDVLFVMNLPGSGQLCSVIHLVPTPSEKETVRSTDLW